MYTYEVYEFEYKKDGSTMFEQLLNDRSQDGWRLVSNQLKPFKNDATNKYEIICVFEKINYIKIL